MGWSDASLGCLLWDEEEVEALVVLLILNKVGVNDTAWRWVFDCGSAVTTLTLDEHPLVDSLVDNDKSDWRNTSELVVEWLENFFELRDFLLDDLVSHSFSDSVSVDDDLAWKVASVFL